MNTCWCGGATAPRYEDTAKGPVIRRRCTESAAHDPAGHSQKTLPQALYLSGPMTGYPESNYPAFFAAAERLEEAGYHVLNPAKPGNRASYEELMRADIKLLLDSDAVATLPNWWASNGARIEVNLAGFLRMPVEPVDHWLLEKEAMV